MKRYSRLTPGVRIIAGLTALLVITLTLRSDSADSGTAQWRSAGQSSNNSRSQPDERQISRENVNSLRVKWAFTTGGDVSATPTVADHVVYFPDWAGNLYAVEQGKGQLIWERKIS